MKKKTYIILLAALMLLSYLSPMIANALKDNIRLPSNGKNNSYQSINEIKLKCGDFIAFGSYLNSPVIWRVADIDIKGKTLLISDKVICFKAFDSYNSESSNLGSAQWETSSLKFWLNSAEKTVKYEFNVPQKERVLNGYNAYEDESGFLHDNNFSEKQRALISDDGVFVPSKDLLNKYLKNNLQKTCTDEAIKLNDAPYIILKSQSVWYWTSTSLDSDGARVVAVTSSGSFYKTLAYDSITGVCPALYLKTNKIISSGGNGEINTPYVIEG